MDENVKTHGFLDFSQQQVHDVVARYLSGYLQTVENESLQKAITDDEKRIFFSFSWLNGQPDTFLQVTINEEPNEGDLVEEALDEA
jgi:hypothetical protein|tara:strand:- start:419 stop:676 length:258 start_codon:yes stop_codon:yes gene_type:complete